MNRVASVTSACWLRFARAAQGLAGKLADLGRDFIRHHSSQAESAPRVRLFPQKMDRQDATPVFAGHALQTQNRIDSTGTALASAGFPARFLLGRFFRQTKRPQACGLFLDGPHRRIVFEPCAGALARLLLFTECGFGPSAGGIRIHVNSLEDAVRATAGCDLDGARCDESDRTQLLYRHDSTWQKGPAADLEIRLARV
jgi:hypothetical protein